MDNYTKISPLGPRNGPGTFDCIFNTEKYKNIEEAEKANDFVKIDFVKDDTETIFFELSHTKLPETKVHKQLQIQHFPFGIDMFDDRMAVNAAIEIIEKYDKDHG